MRVCRSPAPPAPPPPPVDLTPWFTVARGEIGVREIRGAKANPRIVEYLGATTLASHPLGKSDETAWCSAFACWAMEQSGHRSPRSARARDWLKWGVSLPYPCRGCIVVFWRGSPSSGQGHVAFYADDYLPRGGVVNVLGGNQRPSAGEVSVRPYEVARVLGYRWPLGAAMRAVTPPR